jgi:LuxR family maltose regulon positive regulatory protein
MPAHTRGADERRGGTPVGGGASPVLRTKLQARATRPDLVGRPALVEQLAKQDGYRLTLVAAPAGWGKTTLLNAWRAGEARSAWLAVDRWDNDPVRFWTHVVEALRTVEPGVAGEALALLGAPGTRLVESVVPALVNALEPRDERLALVLDDYHLIESREIHESVAFMLEHLPPILRVVVSTRSDPPLPLSRMRARGELSEIRVEQLRFTREEAAEFLNGVLELGLNPEDVRRLHERTEGWAAGLYLAALSLRGREDPRMFIADFAGDDRHVVDYLGSEVLAGQPEEIRSFLLRTSPLERLSGDLCDAVTESGQSARLLREIERANLFLVPLDHRRQWYRYHHLFGTLLLHELQQTEPALVPRLHRRASGWYRAEGSIPEAIHHAIAADDWEEARELVAEHWNAFFNQGRLATVSAWLDQLPESLVADDPRLCVARAWLALDLGRVDEVEDWIEAAGDSLRPETAVLRTVFSFKIGDVGRAREAALETLALAPGEAVFPRTAASCILGIALLWSGERERAIEVFEEAVELARSAGNRLAASYALGYLSTLHAEQLDLERADELAATALGQSDEPGFAEHFTTMMAHLGRAKARERQGDLAGAEEAAARALGLGLRGAARIEIAWAQLTLGEIRHTRGALSEARALIREARVALEQCPDPRGAMRALTDAERRLRLAPVTGPRKPAPDELTDREVAVLRLLDTDLSQREIGDALYVSLNTVKTHVRGILRKLGASNRREAVERARSVGLL